MSMQLPDDRTAFFSKVLRSLLRPLVRALITHGITAPAFYGMLKRIYVEVAEQEFRLDDARQTDSRISMLTGVHRRDVKAFRTEVQPDTSETRQKVTSIASVLGRWLADPLFSAGDGQPAPLPRSAENGPSFEALVRSVSKDIRPRTILDELIRQKLVIVDPASGTIAIDSDAFLGPADLDQRVHFFAGNVGDHMAAAVDNLLADEPKFMERAVFYNRLTEASVREIEQVTRDLGSQALIDINRLANERQTKDLDAVDGTHRFRFGLFFYREDESTQTPPSADDDGNANDDQN